MENLITSSCMHIYVLNLRAASAVHRHSHGMKRGVHTENGLLHRREIVALSAHAAWKNAKGGASASFLLLPLNAW